MRSFVPLVFMTLLALGLAADIGAFALWLFWLLPISLWGPDAGQLIGRLYAANPCSC
jgi:hypothetical protein